MVLGRYGDCIIINSDFVVRSRSGWVTTKLQASKHLASLAAAMLIMSWMLPRNFRLKVKRSKAYRAVMFWNTFPGIKQKKG